MDKDPIKDLFKNYEPQMPDDFAFMKALEYKLDSVELILEQSRRMRRQSRCAALIAIAVSFIAGGIASLFTPYIIDFLGNLIPADFHSGIIPGEATEYKVLSWLTVGLASVISCLSGYEISLALIRRRHTD